MRKEFIPVSEEASNKEKPEKKVDNSNSRTNLFQEEWCVGKSSEGRGVASVHGNELSSETLDSSAVGHNAYGIVKRESVGHVPQQENLNVRQVKEKAVLKKMIKWLSGRMIVPSGKKQQFCREEEK